LAGYDHTHGEQQVGELGEVPFQALVIARAPHALGDLVVLGGTDNFCQQARYVSIVKPASGSFDVAGQKILRNLFN